MHPYSIRFDDQVKQELEYLANLYGMSKSQVIQLLIRQEYSKTKNDPVVTAAAETLAKLREIVSDTNNGQTNLFGSQSR